MEGAAYTQNLYLFVFLLLHFSKTFCIIVCFFTLSEFGVVFWSPAKEPKSVFGLEIFPSSGFGSNENEEESNDEEEKEDAGG